MDKLLLPGERIEVEFIDTPTLSIHQNLKKTKWILRVTGGMFPIKTSKSKWKCIKFAIKNSKNSIVYIHDEDGKVEKVIEIK